MSCGVAIVKFVLFVFNLICALCGIALVVAGISVYWKYQPILEALNENNVQVVPIVFIAIGAAIFLIAFFGCCGAIYESECMISLYAVLLFLLLVAQLVIGVLILTNKQGVKNVTQNTLRHFWKEKQKHSHFWDSAQQLFECCGLDHPTDWGSNIPPSCCKPDVTVCLELINAYKDGCYEVIPRTITAGSNIFGTTAISVAGVELVGFIFACILGNHIRNYKRRYM